MDLFEDNIALVKKIVYKMTKVYGYSQFDDLMQAGLMGLFHATKNFKENLGVKFNTYATYYIIGEIKKELRSTNLIKLNREIYRIIKYLKNFEFSEKSLESISEEKSLTNSLDSSIDIDGIAQELNTTRENVLLAYSYKSRPLSLDTPLNNSGMVFGDDELNPLEIVQVNDSNVGREEKIIDAVEALVPEEKEVIKLRYFKNYTQTEASVMLKKHQSKISRIEKRALKNLRRLINY